MRTILAFPILALLTASHAAWAAGGFDGNWSGQAVGNGTAKGCNGSLMATVTNNVLHGVMKFGSFAPADFGGVIAPDGSFKTPASRVMGTFEGSSFTGSMTVPNGYCNPYRLTMSRS